MKKLTFADEKDLFRDAEIEEQAIEFARANKKSIAKEFTDTKKYPPDDAPVSIFMAGSPGAGKTEFSKRFLEVLESNGRSTVVRIDPDDCRKYFKDYTGSNSFLFQPAISILVDKVHDEVLFNGQNFIFDGTLSNYDRAKYNIERSLSKDRYIEIIFVYQRPELAWRYTKEREVVEGRNIPQDAFIDHFVDSQKTVSLLKVTFCNKIKLNVVIKNIDNSDLIYRENIASIEPYIPQTYTKDELRELLKNDQENITFV